MTSLAELDVERNLQHTIEALRKAAAEIQSDLDAHASKLSASARETLTTLTTKVHDAETYYARALDSKPLYDTLAGIHKVIGDPERAAYFTKQGNTFLADELEFKGRLQAFYGNNAEALARFEDALRLVPDHAFASKGADASRKRVEKAKKELPKLKANAESKATSKDWVSYGSAMADLGQLADAEAAFDKALSADPKNPDALARKGTAIHAAGKPKEALEWYRKALEVKPTSMTGRRGVNYATFQIEHPDG